MKPAPILLTILICFNCYALGAKPVKVMLGPVQLY